MSTARNLVTSPKFVILTILGLVIALTAGIVSGSGPETIGEPLVSRNYIDSAHTAYVYKTGFGASAVGHTVDTWGFFAGGFDEPDISGGNVTPLLLERVGVGDSYVLKAIGKTQAVPVEGLYADLPFDTQEGDATITSGNFYFGWKDGTQTSHNFPPTPGSKGGIINFNRPGGFPSGVYTALNGNSSQNITGADIGSTLSFGNNTLGLRQYSLQATAVAAGLACGDTLTSNTTLEANLVCPPGFTGNALTINTAGVMLDGAGLKIIATGANIAVNVSSTGVTVTDVEIDGFRNGIVGSNAHDLSISGVTMAANVPGNPEGIVIGIQSFGGDRVTLLDNVISVRNSPLYIGDDDHTWTNNTFESTGWYNIAFVTNSTISGNLLSSTPGALAYGLQMHGSGNTFTGNTFTGWYIGLWLNNASNNTVSFNTIRDVRSRFGALYIVGSSGNNTFYGNNFRDITTFYIRDTSSGAPNIFNLAKVDGGGNWYDFYSTTCADSDADGFCDTPLGPGNSGGRMVGATDAFPLTQEVSTAPANQAPVCLDEAFSMDEDTVVQRAVPCSDPDDGDTIQIEIVALNLVGVDPVNVTGPLPFSLPGSSIELKPDPNFNGNGGTYSYQATDSEGAKSEVATATITVSPINDDPVADAGPDQLDIEWTAGGTVTLDGSGSSDPDDDTLTYAWSGDLGNASGVGPTVSVPDIGTYNVTLTVDDGNGGSDTASVYISVVDTTAPVVTAALVPVTSGDDDDDEGLFRVEFSCSDACDANPSGSATLNGTSVTNGQIVALELDDDVEVETDDGMLEMEGPSFVLEVTCTDSSGNQGSAQAEAAFPSDDDDSDSDDDSSGDDDSDSDDDDSNSDDD